MGREMHCHEVAWQTRSGRGDGGAASEDRAAKGNERVGGMRDILSLYSSAIDLARLSKKVIRHARSRGRI